MYFPELSPLETSRRTIYKFAGVNRTQACGENEFSDAMNLSSHDYPCLTTRKPPIELLSIETDDIGDIAFFADDRTGYISAPPSDNSSAQYTLNYGGEDVDTFEFSTGVCSHNIVPFNRKVLFVRGDTAFEFDPSADDGAVVKMGGAIEIEAAHTETQSEECTARLSLLYEDGAEIGNFSMGAENSDFPINAAKDDLYSKYLTYYRLVCKDLNSNSGNEWQPVTSLRLRITLNSQYNLFGEGDYVRLSGFKYWNWAVRSIEELDTWVRIDAKPNQATLVTEPIEIFKKMSFILEAKTFPTNNIAGYNYPIVNNAGNDMYLLEGHISSDMPDMDFLCPGANRVWGCSSKNHEIYASELGRHRNWKTFEGLSGDSYAVTVGSNGDFTSCCTYLGTPVFFKEDQMIIMTGSKPASFQVNSYSYRGVAKDSPDGVCVVNDVLYYKSVDGIYMYSGSVPECISRALGAEVSSLKKVVMGGEGDTLYVSGVLDGAARHYSYDTVHGIWHRYDGMATRAYIRFSDATLEACEEDGCIVIRSLSDCIPAGVEYDDTGAVTGSNSKWYWQSADISYNTPECKYVRNITIDARAENPYDVYIQYDGKGAFSRIAHIAAGAREAGRIRVFPHRCGFFTLRCEGRGQMTLYSITKETEEAAENG